MKDCIRYHHKILAVVAAISAATALAMFSWLDHPAYGAGFVLGSMAGMVKFRLLSLCLMRVAAGQAAGRDNIRSVLHGHILLAGVLALGYCLPQSFYIWTVFAGFVLPNLVLVVDGFLRPTVFAASAGETEQAGEPHEA